MSLVSYCQEKKIIDGDELFLKDSLDGKVVILGSIKRGNQNPEVLWITYDLRPHVDPWRENRKSNESFTEYWLEHEIKILGFLITYDNCLCLKQKP